MTFTLSKFVSDVLKELGIIAASETPTAQDSQDVKDALNQVLSILETESLKTWHYEDGRIPDIKFRPLVALVANELKNSFGVGDQKAMLMEQKAQLAIGDLRRQVEDYESEPVEFSNI